MAFEHTRWVWMNGKCVPWAEATVHVSAHALHYGSGVFEGIRCYQTSEGPAVFRLDAHLERFDASAHAYQMVIPYSKSDLAQAICETIAQNGFTDCYVRPISYRGSSSLNLHPRSCPVEVSILVWPWGKYLGEATERGARITISRWQKFSSQMMPTTAKACGQYLNSILAAQEASDRGFDEALLLNIDGELAEGSGENIFLVRDGKLLTNGHSDSILLGITRDCVIRIASDLGWKVETSSLSLKDLMDSDEAFFTGTAAEVVPITEVDGQRIGDGQPGPCTRTIQRIFSDVTAGRDSRYRAWLHPVAASRRTYA
ncbi:MAG TPA: branched-chain amino acid transaminase [Candidatus Angelobacter sp.]|nr:branched-chain amino acid transaminase [Candidatus Angelobacter sp.]